LIFLGRDNVRHRFDSRAAFIALTSCLVSTFLPKSNAKPLTSFSIPASLFPPLPNKAAALSTPFITGSRNIGNEQWLQNRRPSCPSHSAILNLPASKSSRPTASRSDSTNLFLSATYSPPSPLSYHQILHHPPCVAGHTQNRHTPRHPGTPPAIPPVPIIPGLPGKFVCFFGRSSASLLNVPLPCAKFTGSNHLPLF